MGLAVLIFIRMIESKDIKRNRQDLEAARGMGHETRLPVAAATSKDE